MNRFALSTALVLGLAAPAFASDQLARSAGVEPGVYSTSELVAIIDAQEAGDWKQVNHLTSRVDGSTSSDSAGHVQLARSLNVDPASFTTAELIDLRSTLENDNHDRARFVKDTPNGSATATMSSKGSTQSAGHVQLARSLDVNPDDFTTAQLVQLRNAEEDDNHHRANVLRAQANS